MSIDRMKAGQAVSHPGIDPRDFVRLAIVTAVSVDADGHYADVVTIPDRMEETVSISPPYGGNGYGFYMPVDLDEQVVIALPAGEFNAGGRVIGGTWDPAYRPPTEAIENRDDVVLVVKPGQSCRIIVKGGGNVHIDAQDGGVVLVRGDAQGLASVDAPVQTMEDGNLLLNAIVAAAATIAVGNPQGAAALLALRDSLQALDWPRCSTVLSAHAGPIPLVP
jgi:hypothetical protein